ncbi:hypothetical protein NOVOSPHI9U_630010 [Novosphingobium sp. 9U]|nr:hypothetical protein NOVOSPHI9U_630010 [Novosphingobium sp. 9U]
MAAVDIKVVPTTKPSISFFMTIALAPQYNPRVTYLSTYPDRQLKRVICGSFPTQAPEQTKNFPTPPCLSHAARPLPDPEDAGPP